MLRVEIVIGKEFLPKLTPYLKAANKTLDICVYDFRLYSDQPGNAPQLLLSELRNAQKRGVKIRLLTMRLESIATLKSLGLDAKHWQGGKTLHAKFFIIDGKVGVIGSHNWTLNALMLNHEVSAILQDEQAIPVLQKYFNDLWSL